jgi:peptide/nickel transport system permease protein
MKRWSYFFKRWQNVLGLALVLTFVLAAILAPKISPMDPKSPGPFKKVGTGVKLDPLPPSEDAILGTLPRRFDVFHALVWGTRDALIFGLIVVVLAGVFGVFFGAISGYAGSAVNNLMMRVTDAFLAFPIIAGVVFLQQLILAATGGSLSGADLGRGNLSEFMQFLLQYISPMTLGLILFSWMPYARLINTTVINLKSAEFITAARVIGLHPSRVLWKHLIPNAISPAIVLAARDIGWLVVLQATFTFIGMPGGSIWGEILVRGRGWFMGAGGNIFTYWWVILPTTLAVILFGIGWNLLGDGLNDLLDPNIY